MRRNSSVFVASVLLLALSACTSRPSGTPNAYGSVSGTLVLEGGPAPGTAKTPIPGTIELSAHGHRTVTIKVPVNGVFREQVPAGRYEVAATTPRVQHEDSSGRISGTGSCPHSPITVTAGETRSIQVTCFVP
jgi:hypothetical protein